VTVANQIVPMIARLAASRGPALTWYSVSGERIELSGPVLAQWVAKVSHLLLDIGAEPGETVAVDLGADWRAPMVWLAAWWDGLLVSDHGDDGDGGDQARRPDYAVVREDRVSGATAGSVSADCLVVVPTAALAPAVSRLPAGATDFATARSFPDQPPPAAHETTAPLLDGGQAGRILLGPSSAPAELLAVWSGGGAVIWHDGLDDAALARVVGSERLPAAQSPVAS